MSRWPKPGMDLCVTWNNYGKPRAFISRVGQCFLCLRWACRVLVQPDLVRTEIIRSSGCIQIMERVEKEVTDE